MRRAALLLAPLLVAACAGLPVRMLPLPPGDERPQRLLRALDRATETRRALRGRAELAVDSDDGEVRLRGRQVLALARPDRLRVEVLGLLGQAEAVLVTRAGHYQLFVTGQRLFLGGPLYPGLLWDVARIDLEPAQVIGLLLGAPQRDGSLELTRALAGGDGGVRLDLAGAGGQTRETLVFDGAGRLVRLVRFRGAERLFEARFDDYAPVAGEPMAHSIALEFERSGTRATLSLRDVELNPGLSDALFRLEPPGQGG